MSARKISRSEYHQRRMNALESVAVINIISPCTKAESARMVEAFYDPSEVDSIHV